MKEVMIKQRWRNSTLRYKQTLSVKLYEMLNMHETRKPTVLVIPSQFLQGMRKCQLRSYTKFLHQIKWIQIPSSSQILAFELPCLHGFQILSYVNLKWKPWISSENNIDLVLNTVHLKYLQKQFHQRFTFWVIVITKCLDFDLCWHHMTYEIHATQ